MLSFVSCLSAVKDLKRKGCLGAEYCGPNFQRKDASARTRRKDATGGGGRVSTGSRAGGSGLVNIGRAAKAVSALALCHRSPKRWLGSRGLMAASLICPHRGKRGYALACVGGALGGPTRYDT